MKVIVGLGNPGSEHRNNRHNAGFMVVDRLAETEGVLEWENKFESMVTRMGDILLMKPQTFMNRSGEAVAKLMNFYKAAVADLFVIHDDLDIRLGEYKIQMGVGPKVHNGVGSVEQSLGKTDFWRVRMGVDNRDRRSELRTQGEEYVLADFLPEEKRMFDEEMAVAIEEVEKKLK